MTRLFGSVIVLGVLVSTTSSCRDVVPVPLTQAPTNTCETASDCAVYAGSNATCKTDGICEVPTLASRPEFPFWVVIHLPDTVSSAPGLAYVLVSDANGEPAFVAPTSDAIDPRCSRPLCQTINVANAEGRYIASVAAAREVGYPLEEDTALPLRVVYESSIQTQLTSLPLGGALIAKSPIPGSVAQRFIPFGLYHRAVYPQPPFDSYFPPYRDDDLVDIKARRFVRDFTLSSIDATRKAKVSREEGLDGWRVWLADPVTRTPISVVRTLSGTIAADVPLFTFGVKNDDFDAVVAPPQSWVAVPRFVTPIFGGQGLGTLDYPRIPPPVTVTGVVAERGTGETLLGYAAAIAFESQRIATLTEQTSLLRYETTVVTDERGRFATVLPPGRYVATIDPAQGTGHAIKKVLVEVDRAVTSLTLHQAPALTRVTGRAVLTDGRSLAEADVVAVPYDATNGIPSSELAATPRPGRARTSVDGHFAMELDEGSYVISVIPKAGTGFPRFVVRADIPSSVSVPSTELADVRVPPPSRLSFRVADVPDRQSPVNPIPNAVVRVFARPVPRSGQSEGEGEPVEIGSAMTDDDGEVKLLLPPQPR